MIHQIPPRPPPEPLARKKAAERREMLPVPDAGIPHREVLTSVKELLLNPAQLQKHLSGLKDEALKTELLRLNNSEENSLSNLVKMRGLITKQVIDILHGAQNRCKPLGRFSWLTGLFFNPAGELINNLVSTHDYFYYPNEAKFLAEIAERPTNKEVIEKHLHAGLSPNYTFPDNHKNYPGMTLAQVAVKNGQVEMLKLLLENGANPNTPLPDNHRYYPSMTLAQVAVMNSQMEMLKLLLENGANPNTPLPDNHRYYPSLTLAQVAAMHGHMEMVKLLLENGADLNAPLPDNHRYYPSLTLAQVAAMQGDMEMLKLLLENGAQLEPNYTFQDNHESYPRMTLAQSVASKGDTEMLELLLEKGAQLEPNYTFPDNHKNYPGMTLLDIALENKQDAVVQLLIRYGAKASVGTHALVDDSMFKVSAQQEIPDVSPDDLQKAGLGTSVADLATKLNNGLFRDIFNVPVETIQDREERDEPFNLGEVQQHVLGFLESVTKREPVAGAPSLQQNPEDFKKFYDDLEKMLQHIFLKLSDPEVDNDLKKTALINLMIGQLHCGTRRYQETFIALALIKPELILSDVSAVAPVERLLYQQRVTAFQKALPNTDVHTYNGYMTVMGQALGVARPGSSYNDPLAYLTEEGLENFRKKFDVFYSPTQIIKRLHQSAREKTEIGSGVIPGLLSDFSPHFSQVQRFEELKKLRKLLTKVQEDRLEDLHKKKSEREDQIKRIQTFTASKEAQEKLANMPELNSSEKAELSGLESLEKTGDLSKEDWDEFETLTQLQDNESGDYEEQVLDGGYPSREGVGYLLLAMGVLKPGPIAGIPFSPLLQKLIAKKRAELAKAEPGSELHRNLTRWLEGLA